MVCKSCNIPYEDRYRTKPMDSMVEAVRLAVEDPLQPAHHLLVSGGTPSRRDVGYLRDVYERILTEFPTLATDIMMVPVDGLFDLQRLDSLGLNEISVNIEIFDRTIAADVMRQKYRQGLDYYLQFLADAASILGGDRVRSMLMVGLESVDSTLDGVRAIVERGCVPVLSPFRPDPATPLSGMTPLSAQQFEEVYLRAVDIAAGANIALGPDCPPCSHNTLSFVRPGAAYRHPMPQMI
jgi:hypothetical protein